MQKNVWSSQGRLHSKASQYPPCQLQLAVPFVEEVKDVELITKIQTFFSEVLSFMAVVSPFA